MLADSWLLSLDDDVCVRTNHSLSVWTNQADAMNSSILAQHMGPRVNNGVFLTKADDSFLRLWRELLPRSPYAFDNGAFNVALLGRPACLGLSMNLGSSHVDHSAPRRGAAPRPSMCFDTCPSSAAFRHSMKGSHPRARLCARSATLRNSTVHHIVPPPPACSDNNRFSLSVARGTSVRHVKNPRPTSRPPGWAVPGYSTTSCRAPPSRVDICHEGKAASRPRQVEPGIRVFASFPAA